jgi:hypothetical protein
MDREDQELDARIARYRELAAPAEFDAGFSDRVMARLADTSSRGAPSVSDGLQRAFVRLAPLAAAAVLVLALLNLRSTRSANQPIIERVLGLPAVSIAAAYTFEGGLQ